jgi:hypothetical protein
MESFKKINVLDESLRLAWLESSQESESLSSDLDFNIILENNYHSSMTLEKKRLLQDVLFSKLNSLSLGQLITNSIQQTSLSIKEVASQTNIPISVIEELKADYIFPNNVPIMLFYNLLKLLSIPFKLVDQAAWKTVDIIKSRTLLSGTNFLNTEPAFRRKQNISQESLIKINKRSDGRELFENEDSLKKYLNKLGCLMNNSKNGDTNI